MLQKRDEVVEKMKGKKAEKKREKPLNNKELVQMIRDQELKKQHQVEEEAQKIVDKDTKREDVKTEEAKDEKAKEEKAKEEEVLIRLREKPLVDITKEIQLPDRPKMENVKAELPEGKSEEMDIPEAIQ